MRNRSDVVAAQLETSAVIVRRHARTARHGPVEQPGADEREELLDVDDRRSEHHAFEARVVVVDERPVRLRRESAERQKLAERGPHFVPDGDRRLDSATCLAEARTRDFRLEVALDE